MRFARILTVLIAVSAVSSCSGSEQTDPSKDSAKYESKRLAMVASQIEARGISDSLVLAAMRKVERHLFVPKSERFEAYRDYPLPIGEGQTISQPYIVALMTELLELDGDEKVLEIGTGSGYQAAILAEIADSVFTIEIVSELGLKADSLLKRLGYENVFVMIGDGYAGWEEHAPYDAIVVTAAPPEIPRPLLEQMAEGGRLVIPVGTRWQELMLVTKINGQVNKKSVLPVRFVPMTGKAQEDKE